MKKVLYIVLGALVLAGCHHAPEMDPALLETPAVSLKVKGKSVFTFDGNTSQMAWNATSRTFRAGNDDMTAFFTLTCSELPHEDGQKLKADVTWKNGGSLKSKNGATFQVGKTDLATGQVWLWSASEKIGAVIRIF